MEIDGWKEGKVDGCPWRGWKGQGREQTEGSQKRQGCRKEVRLLIRRIRGQETREGMQWEKNGWRNYELKIIKRECWRGEVQQ